jgi:UV DNA damage endonuclease
MTSRFGYCCINTTLQKQGITCNRAMRKATFEQKGLNYVSQLVIENLRDLKSVLQWNADNGIELFRMSSDMVPWASEYNILDLPRAEAIVDLFERIGNLTRSTNQRLSFHPAQFNCLGSPNESVILNSIKDMSYHGEIMDLMGLPRDRSAKINIHIGGSYGDHATAVDRWCRNIERLPESVLSRLTVENDDKRNMFSTKMLYESVFKRTGIPIVFDSLHFACGPQDSSYSEAFEMAISTWPQGIRPTCHHSSSRKIHEDPTTPSFATHSDYIHEPFDDLGHSVDVALEVKAKELALFDYHARFSKTTNVLTEDAA